MKRELPEKCTLCGEEYARNSDGRRMIFPYPPNHYLCRPCVEKSLDVGLARLNYILAGGELEGIHKANEAKDTG